MRATQPQQTARAPQTELEADGLPSQVAPQRARRMEPDDPREPYSPNYGNPAPTNAPAPQRQRAAATVPVAPAAPPLQPLPQRAALGAKVAAAMPR